MEGAWWSFWKLPSRSCARRAEGPTPHTTPPPPPPPARRRTRAPRKAKPKARKTVAKPAPVEVPTPSEPDVTELLAEGLAEEETLEDATLVQEEELEPVL